MGNSANRLPALRVLICRTANRAAARAAPALTRYLYSANRRKYPLVRKRLIRTVAQALFPAHSDPVLAWESIMNDPQKCQSYKQVRGHGGFIRSNWKELNQLIAAANVWTIKTYGRIVWRDFHLFRRCRWFLTPPEHVICHCLAVLPEGFYDWYCDLSARVANDWGEQTDACRSPPKLVYQPTLCLGL